MTKIKPTSTTKRTLLILVAIAVAILTVVGLIIYQRILSPMNELSEVSKELRVVYDNILKASGENVTVRTFGMSVGMCTLGRTQRISLADRRVRF